MKPTHTIAWGPRFQARTNEGRFGCSCGFEDWYREWDRTDTFAEHRKSVGLRTANLHQWLTDGTKFMKSTAPSECPKGHVGRMRIHDGRWRCNECANEWARDARAKRREQVAA